MSSKFHFSQSGFGTKLRACRRASGLTQEQLARRIGVDAQQIHKYESGKQQPPLERLFDILIVLGIPILEVIDMDAETAEKLFGWKRDTIIPPNVEPQVLVQAIADKFAGLENQIAWLKDARD